MNTGMLTSGGEVREAWVAGTGARHSAAAACHMEKHKQERKKHAWVVLHEKWTYRALATSRHPAADT